MQITHFHEIFSVFYNNKSHPVNSYIDLMRECYAIYEFHCQNLDNADRILNKIPKVS